MERDESRAGEPAAWWDFTSVGERSTHAYKAHHFDQRRRSSEQRAVGLGEGGTRGLNNQSREEASIGVSSLGCEVGQSWGVGGCAPAAAWLRSMPVSPKSAPAHGRALLRRRGAGHGFFRGHGQELRPGCEEVSGEVGGLQLARNPRRLSNETPRTSNAIAGDGAAASKQWNQPGSDAGLLHRAGGPGEGSSPFSLWPTQGTDANANRPSTCLA